MSIIYEALVYFTVLAIVFVGGCEFEHDKYVKMLDLQETAAKNQQHVTEEKDKNNEQNAIVAQQSATSAILGVSDYYNKHPVITTRLLKCSATSAAMPQTNTSASGIDSPSPDGYVSPYNPEDTELIANQLDKLLKLLKDDGVIFDENE